MSSIAEIKHHIKAINDTAKITRAMHLISSSKMKKAVRAHDQNMKYFKQVRSNMRFILDNSPEGFRSVFYRDHGKRCAFLVIAGDKGMCGGYNQDLFKLALQKTAHSLTHQRTRLLTFGYMAARFFERRGIPVDASYLTAVQNPTLDFARELAIELCIQYEQYEFDEVFIIFTQLLRGGMTLPTCLHILPINNSAVMDVTPTTTLLSGLTFEPNLADALDAMARHYVTGILYSALVQSHASENRSRMEAMESATRNAEEMLKELTLMLNHARQAAITQEINEIIGGNPHSFSQHVGCEF